MPLTLAQGEAALRQVVSNVMNQPDNGPLERSLTNAKLIDVGLLGSLIESDIENLTYVAATEEAKHHLRLPFLLDPANEGSFEPSLRTSDTVVRNPIPSEMAGSTSRRWSSTSTASLVHSSMGLSSEIPCPLPLAVRRETVGQLGPY
jgi:hypothetical protein